MEKTGSRNKFLKKTDLINGRLLSVPHGVFITMGFQPIKRYFYPMALRPNAGHGLLILDEVCRSHTTTHHSR